ncbi:ABC transporter substrate-binding protein [Halorarum halophilum]|uniref:ABC transporter substrate-binding protein n=1 Tax=Halorarum halophilum TaxID=2743090 RepID=A0A7D5GDW4_9EURY|nr:ABC transporter substrate-binding protein [Halobaculum halophilum]QLG29265.1 ABC transporter substrate-binding protein [Halobaculum halophilum]
MATPSPVATRRRTLAALGATAGTALTGGCLDQLRSVASRNTSQRVSLDIKAPPADEDPMAIAIARTLAENLHAVGIASQVTPVAIEELYRQVLINNDFDVYVGRYPTTSVIGPDEFYPLLHSRFTGEAGWQNPFGCTDLTIDELLDRQRTTTGEERNAAVTDLQGAIDDVRPFSVLAFPDDLSAVREGRYEGWIGTAEGFDTPLGLLGLDKVTTTVDASEGDEAAAPDRLRLATTDVRVTENRNPVAVEFRNTGAFTGLVYDSLARQFTDEIRPWLATSWEWPGEDETEGRRTVRTDGTESGGGTPGNGTAAGTPGNETAATPASTGTPTGTGVAEPTAGNGTETGTERTEEADGTVTIEAGEGELSAIVRLREGLTWHDGEPLTAADVAFTYEFLTDTSMGELESPVPAPRFRGQSSLVTSARAIDDRTLALRFNTTNRRVAAGALTVPILPEHVWTERTGKVDVPGLGTEGVTEALVWANPEPVGSGPLEFERATAGESVLFSRFEEHFLASDEPPEGLPERLHGKPAFDELFVQAAPSDSTAVELATAGDVDATISQLNPSTVPRIGRTNELRLVSSRSWSFYHLGFNMRRSPLSNPHFRGAISRLLDAERVANEQFGGYARPAATPLAGSKWEAPELRWDQETRNERFHGRNGELDVERARTAFREAGYRYDEEGRLRH